MGKGRKGKFSNERNHIGQQHRKSIYERIIINRIKEKVKLSDPQTGEKKYSVTIDKHPGIKGTPYEF